MSHPENFEACRDLVRSTDPDRYLTALLAPRAAHAGLMALYAYNAELSRIPDLVSEAMLGEIRLQWWRDALDHMNGDTETGAPVADALAQAIAAHKMPKALLLGMADARSADLDGGGFEDMQALKAYLYKTHGALFELSARMLGAPFSEHDLPVKEAAVAYGIPRLLTALPRDAAAGRVMLPLTVLQQHGLTPEEVLAGSEGEGIRDVVADLSRDARCALADAREILSLLERPVQGVFAPLGLVEPALNKLEKKQARPLHDITHVNPLVRFVRIWHAARRGRF